MSIALTAEVSAQLSASQRRPALLFEMGIDSGTTLYWTSSNADITFPSGGGGTLYQAKAIRVSGLQQSAEGQINRITVDFDNTARDMSAYVNAYDLEGKPLIIKRIYLGDIGAAARYVGVFQGEMESPEEIGRSWVPISATAGKSLDRQTLLDIYQRQCRHTFGDKFCNADKLADIDSVADLVAYYPLDESAGVNAPDDKSSSDGTLTNGPTWQTGKIGTSCVSFTQAHNHYIALPNNILSVTQPFSIMMWVNPRYEADAAANQDPRLFNIVRTPSSSSFQIALSGQSIPCCYFDQNHATTVTAKTSGVTIPTDAWSHIAVSIIPPTPTISMYIDRTLKTLSNGGLAETSENGNAIGRGKNGGEANGKIDDVRLYARDLTLDEVRLIFNYGESGHTTALRTSGNIKTGNSTYFTDTSMTVEANVDDLWNYGLVKVGKSGTTYPRIVKDFTAGTSRVDLMVNLPSSVDTDYRYEIVKGCPKTWEACTVQAYAYGPRGNNTDNFGGFLNIDQLSPAQGGQGQTSSSGGGWEGILPGIQYMGH